MRKKRILSLLLSLVVCIAFMPTAVFADGWGTAVTNQATISNVTTSDEFKAALENSEIEEIHITGSVALSGSLEYESKKIIIETGGTLTWGGYSCIFEAALLEIKNDATFTVNVSSAGSKATVKGTVTNNGAVEASGKGNCYWEAITTGNGTFNSNCNVSYINYGTIPINKISGSNYKINIVKDVSKTPNVTLPKDMQTGQTITPSVTNLIDGVDITKVFDFEWRNGSSQKIYNGATSPTLTESGTLRLILSTKAPYVMRTSSGTKGSIDTSGTVTQALLSTVYVDAANGDDNNLGNTADAAVNSLRSALNKVNADGTIILQSNCDMNSTSFKKNVTIKSADDEKYVLNTLSTGPNYINNGITVTFDTVNLSNTKFSGNTGPGNFVFNNCEGSGISITSGIADNITINNSNLSGTFYATTKLTLEVATITGSFNAGQLDVTGSCRLNLKKNAPAVIKGSVDFKGNALITIFTENLARGEKLIQVPKNTAESIVNKFELSGTENGKYVLKCRETDNGTYIGISECISIDDGKLAVAYEPAIGNAVIDTTSNGSKYVTFNPGNVVGVTSGIWSGYSNSSDKKWSLNDSPELTVVLSAGMDSSFYHFDEHFSVNDLKIYSRKSMEEFADYSDAALNSSVTKSVKTGQGVSNDGRTFTFTVTYPQVAKLAQTITGDINDITVNCGDEILRTATAKGAISYESSDSSIVSVDANGKITAHKAGSVTITVNAAETEKYAAASVTYTVTVNHPSGGSYNPVQKPEIITGEGGKTSLENNGTTLVITPDEGMEISKVTVNGKEVTVTDNKITGLKTGDKVEVTFAKTPPTKEEIDNIFKGKALKLELIVRTSKTPKKNIKAVVKETSELNDLIKEIKDAGYTVKYKFYRSTKKSSKYEARLTKTEGKYINTIGKKGTKYYYKAKLLIYDTEGNLVAQTELKQCRYGLRTWSK